jgi:hypothetical protein
MKDSGAYLKSRLLYDSSSHITLMIWIFPTSFLFSPHNLLAWITFTIVVD